MWFMSFLARLFWTVVCLTSFYIAAVRLPSWNLTDNNQRTLFALSIIAAILATTEEIRHRLDTLADLQTNRY